ncbi:MAG TPA: ChaN family lipoprotein [Bacteroidales bacterium]|nr:ChaN family lipoprotein [Bacteroidales bacterium]HPM93727.1 ChaN family lipoprotein [Bacteroidales bacterium]
MKRGSVVLGVLFMLTVAMKSDKPAYIIFDVKGKQADYKDLLKSAADADIVFFGEMHDSPICHWLQYELTNDLFKEVNEDLILGAEMFETDNQLILDEYLAGKIKDKNFEDEAKLWDNYKTDYKPLVKYALDKKLRFIATNVPRRYASLVNKSGFEGLDSLTTEANAYLPPLPITYDPELEGYKSMMEMMEGAGGHASPNLPKAQALKDATMAHFILKNIKKGDIFLHFNGTYHSNNFEGIVWYIKKERPDLKIITIASVEQDSPEELTEENSGLADFTICIPSTMSKSY